MTSSAAKAMVVLNWPIAQYPNSNRDRKKHWTKERAEGRAIRTAAALLGQQAAAKCGQLTAPVDVTLAFAFPDRRRRDLTNYSPKALLDGLVDGGLLIDDDHRHIRSVTFRHDPDKADVGKVRVTVTITERSAA